MSNQRLFQKVFIFSGLILFSFSVHASFIESTMGTAVVNDATATFYNPAALTLLKNSQVIALGSASNFRSRFTGQTIQTGTGFTQTGSATGTSNYFLPSFYLGSPSTEKITIGLAVISNFFNSSLEENSILRYAKSGNTAKNIDFVPAIGIKINEFFSFGAGINFSYANFLMQPTIGFPSLNIPDTESRNQNDGTGWGGDVGFLLKLPSTVMGFNYRSAITYHLTGNSVYEGNPEIVSNNYSFTIWTPARYVFSISHFVSPSLGFISTVQRIQWSIFKNINVNGIATPTGIQSATLPFYMRDTWILTLGTQYRVNPKWIIRVAGSYNQSAGNNNYQVSNGDSVILGASIGYEIFKNFLIDGSYAHAFFQNENINIASSRNIVNGVNSAALDSVSLKLTCNLDKS